MQRIAVKAWQVEPLMMKSGGEVTAGQSTWARALQRHSLYNWGCGDGNNISLDFFITCLPQGLNVYTLEWTPVGSYGLAGPVALMRCSVNWLSFAFQRFIMQQEEGNLPSIHSFVDLLLWYLSLIFLSKPYLCNMFELDESSGNNIDFFQDNRGWNRDNGGYLCEHKVMRNEQTYNTLNTVFAINKKHKTHQNIRTKSCIFR